MHSKRIIDILYGSLIRIHISYFFSPLTDSCVLLVGWHGVKDGRIRPLMMDEWSRVWDSPAAAHRHTPMSSGACHGDGGCRWGVLPGILGTSKAASHQKFFFFLISVCVCCRCVLWCFYASGRVSKRSFSAELLSVFLFSYVCVFPFISSQAHVAKLAVKSLYRGPSPNFNRGRSIYGQVRTSYNPVSYKK